METANAKQSADNVPKQVECYICKQSADDVPIKHAVLGPTRPIPTLRHVCLGCTGKASRDKRVYRIHDAIRKIAEAEAFAEAMVWFEDVFAAPTHHEVPGVADTDASYRCHYPKCDVHAATASATHAVRIQGKAEERPLLYGFPVHNVEVPHGPVQTRVFAACFVHATAAQRMADAKREKLFYRPLKDCFAAIAKAAEKPRGATCNACRDVSGSPDQLARDVPVFDPAAITSRDVGIRLLDETGGPYRELVKSHGDDREEAKRCPLHGTRMRALGGFRYHLITLMKANGWWDIEPAVQSPPDRTIASRQNRQSGANLPMCPECGVRRVKRSGHTKCSKCFGETPKKSETKSDKKGKKQDKKENGKKQGRK